MAELEYSGEALNALNKFYRCDTIVYVEGDDDELFWATVFERCSSINVVAHSVGGSVELDKYISRIVSENLKSIAARDADFLVCSGTAIEDPRVIYTYGYSIENTLYTDAAVAQIAKTWCKGKGASRSADCSKWMSEFHASVELLASYDAANFIHGCGLSITGDSIKRFAKRASSYEIDDEKLKMHCQLIAVTISDEMISTALHHSIKSGWSTSKWIRGHFLASAVLQFISSHIKAVGLLNRISNDALYASAMHVFDSSFGPRHPHYVHYQIGTLGASAVFLS